MKSEFCEWLTKMQDAASLEYITVEAQHYDVLDHYFKMGNTPEEALYWYKPFLKRIRALDPATKPKKAPETKVLGLQMVKKYDWWTLFFRNKAGHKMAVRIYEESGMKGLYMTNTIPQMTEEEFNSLPDQIN